MNLIIGFANEVLLFTNIWIFLYNNILRFLDIHFPAQVNGEFIRSGAVPEPFEISLYLFLSFLMVLFIFLLHRYFKKTPPGYHLITRYIIFVLLLLLFLKNIGNYPMGRDTYPYGKQDSQTYLFYILIYLATTGLIFFEGIIFSRFLGMSKKIGSLIFFSCISLIIAVLTFEPRFPLVGHDYSYFFGPIWEITHGKTIYTQVPSQYGFASILLLSLFYKLRLVSFAHLPVVTWILYIIQYLLCFYLIYKVSKSVSLSLIGLLSTITINYFSLYHLPATIPQIGPFRWLPLIITLYLFYKYKNIGSKKLIFSVGLLSFWIIDTGISLILSFLFTLFILKLVNLVNMKKFVVSIFWLLLSLVFIFFSINLINIIFGYQIINMLSVFWKLKQYGQAGFGMLPIDSYVYFWVVILVYFATIIYFFRKQHRDFFDQLILFSANISLFTSTYYVGRSHQHNLFTIALFFLLNSFLLLSRLYFSINSQKVRVISFLGLIFFFIIFPAFERQEVITEMIQEKIRRFTGGNIFKPELDEILKQRYPTEIALIKKSIPEKQIVILSADDTYLFYLSGKENLMMDNSQITILTNKDIDFSLQNVFKACPKKIVVDCQFMNKCDRSNPFVIGFFNIQPQLLNRIQEVCKFQYRPVECTSQLCIAQVQ
ncbi:hypothetical protein HY357_03690 [Candidatus Roizmanbacteria bacterium]|nr:hypothetical protein [Candidatus Roizmanbacteria bacterium]